MNASSLLIKTPAPYDVLCGQDATYGQHQGNRILRHLVEQTVESYQKASRRAKAHKIHDIVTIMRDQYQSRFLRRPQQGFPTLGWEEIAPQAARDKVSHALRFAAIQRKHKKNKAKSAVKSLKQMPPMPDLKNPATLPCSLNVKEIEELDERSKRRLEILYQRQQAILQDMLAGTKAYGDDEMEESSTGGSCRSMDSCSTTKTSHTRGDGINSSTEETLPQEEIARVGPNSVLMNQRDDFSMQSSTNGCFQEQKSCSFGPDCEKKSGVSRMDSHSLPRVSDELSTPLERRPQYELRGDDYFATSLYPPWAHKQP